MVPIFLKGSAIVDKTGWQKINGKWYYFGGEQDG